MIESASGRSSSSRLYERADKSVIGFRYGGFASQSLGENPIYYVVINKDKWISLVGYRGDLSGENRRNHEYEHQKNKLFRAVFEYKDAPTQLVGYVGEQFFPQTHHILGINHKLLI